jgi:putative ABC transport system permease protein
MRTLLKLGWRNIWRNRRRTLINMSAIGIGLFLVVAYGSIVDALMNDAKSQMANSGMGHVEIYAPGFRGKQNVGAFMENPGSVLARLQLPEGALSGARVVARGLATTAHGGQGVLIHGVDPAREASIASYVSDIREGAPLAAGDDRGILVGEKLAERLKVRVGQKVRLMAQRTDGEMGADLFRVRGIFHSVAAGISKSRVIVTAKAAQTLLGLPDAANQIVIQLARAEDADRVAASLRAQLGAGFDVVTYGELLPVLKTLERTMSTVMSIAAFFVYLLVSFGILNTMLMSVLERTHEFGVMQAIGNRPGRIRALIVAESFWVATVSVAVGLALGLAFTAYGSHHTMLDFRSTLGESMELGGAVVKSTLRTEFSPLSSLRSASYVYVVTLLVALYPAWRVSRMLPAHALRAM